MTGSTATEVAGWALALGTIATICVLATVCTFVAMKRTAEMARTRLPDWAAGLLAAVVALLTFVGGWLILALWWTGARGTRLVHRLAVTNR